MKPPLKLSDIEQEHLQELYDAAGLARDDLPYSTAYEKLVEDFQDRTFKNADGEQVFGALLKYARTGAFSVNPEGETTALSEEQAKQLKQAVMRHGSAGKLLPYSDPFVSAKNEFNKISGMSLSEGEFWRAFIKTAGNKRRPPPPRKKAVKVEEDEE